MSSKPTERKAALKDRFLRNFLYPLREAVYEFWVWAKERDGILLKKVTDGYIPDKAGRRLGYQQWRSTPFKRRDELCEALPLNDPEALVKFLFLWKDHSSCTWHAITDMWDDPYIKDTGLEIRQVVNIKGASQVERTQWIAARTFAELLMAWPDNPARNRFGRLDR